MKDRWSEGYKGRVPVPNFLKLTQMKAKPHESDYFLFHPRFLQKNHTLSTLGWVAHHFTWKQKLDFAASLNVFSTERLSVFVSPGAKQSSSSLLDCFFQINIFPKDLNPKQQPRLKSNTTQTFRSIVSQLLQVLGMVQSVVVYSIAKMFTWTLCLYTASYTYKHCESMEISAVLFQEILLWRIWIVEMTIKTSKHQRCVQVKSIFCATRWIS